MGHFARAQYRSRPIRFSSVSLRKGKIGLSQTIVGIPASRQASSIWTRRAVVHIFHACGFLPACLSGLWMEQYTPIIPVQNPRRNGKLIIDHILDRLHIVL